MKKALIRLAVLLCTAIAAADVKIDVFTDTRKVYQGESFQLTVAVSGVDNPGQKPDVSALAAAADIVDAGSQSISRSSITIINGRRTEDSFRGRHFRYLVMPKTAGSFIPGPVRYRDGSKTVEASGAPVSVTGVEKQDSVLLTLTPSRPSVLVGEPFSLLISVSVRQLSEPYAEKYEPFNPRQPAHLQSDLFEMRKDDDKLAYPDINELLGSLIGKMTDKATFTINDYKARPQGFGFASLFGADPFAARPMQFRFPVKREKIGEIPYLTYSILLPYVPLKEGELRFGPVSFKGQIISDIEEVDGVPQARMRQIYALTDELIMKVELPPVENRPASFIGGIGSSLAANATLDTVSCKVGDPLTLRLEVTGDIRPESLRPPEIEAIDGVKNSFRIYGDSVKTETLANGKRFTYRVRPTVPGTLEFPSIPVAYFDIEKRDYQIVNTQPIPLRAMATVQIAAAADEETDDGVLPVHGASAITLNRDGIKTRSVLLGDINQRWAAVALIAPPVLFIVTLLLPRLLVLPRKLRTYLSCVSAGAKAVSAIRASQSATECASAIRTYLSRKLKIQAAGATPAEVENLLRRAGVEETEAVKLRKVLEDIDGAIFRPDSDGGFDNGQVVEAVRAVDKALAKPARAKKRGASALMLFFILSAMQGNADDSLRTFLWERAAAQTMSAASSNDFAAAAQTYRRIVDDGACNGALFYNLANTLLLAGDTASAKTAFQRSERYDGATFATSTGIACIEAIERNASTMEMPWSRIAFFWHYMLPCSHRFVVTLVSWALFWAVLSLRTVAPGRQRLRAVLRAVSLVALSAAIVFGVSCAVSTMQERIDSSAEESK